MNALHAIDPWPHDPTRTTPESVAIGVDDVTLAEAAKDLLEAKDRDYRTIGYREDLWNCLHDILAAPTGIELAAP